MSKDQSHPPHTRARLSKAGLFAAGIVTTALVIGVVTAASASPSGPFRRPVTPGSPGVGSTVSRVAGTAESVVTQHRPMSPQQVLSQVHQKTESSEAFYNTLRWDWAVSKNEAWDRAVLENELKEVAYLEAVARAKAAAAAGSGFTFPPSVAPMFACIRNAESGGNYSAVNSSSGAGGAYQFMPSTWASLGGQGLAQDAPPSLQDAMAYKLYQRDGWSPWAGDPCVG